MRKDAVLCFGGRGGEAKVSVASAQNLAQVFPFKKLLFLNDRNDCFDVDKEDLLNHQNPFVTEFRPKATLLGPFLDVVQKDPKGVYFFGFHGDQGEDGTLQKAFEELGIMFTGSGSQASALCFDKDRAKRAVAEKGLKIMEGLTEKLESPAQFCESVRKFFLQHGPLVVKPRASGSSVGLFFVHHEEQILSLEKSLIDFVGEIFLLEKFCSGREFTVGVLDQLGETRALVASEVILTKNAKGGFDYQAKYLGKGVNEITPAQVSVIEMEQLKGAAIRAHQALGCYGYSRTDFLMNSEGELVFLETNTLPGMTHRSFIPQQLMFCGISMSQFIEGQLELALKRYRPV
jgi:D-alanine-D-alanine ligase